MAVEVATSTFAGAPQPVEIYHRGIWYSGELLGWRHESDGRCLARVACRVGKLRYKAWKDLADLRLPQSADGIRSGAAGSRPAADSTSLLDDATRPHVLLADLRSRPRTPAHALTPPLPRPRVPREQLPPPRWAVHSGSRLHTV